MQSRTHLALAKDDLAADRASSAGRIVVTLHADGLHYRYDRASA